MPKLEELLKTKGYTEEDLKGLEPLLTNQKFRTTLEDSIQELSSEKDKAVGEAQNWATWYQNEALPKIDKALENEQAARAAEAAAQARIKTLQDQGLLKIAEQEDRTPTPQAGGDVFDPKKHNLVTFEDAGKMLEGEGQAIAMAQDISMEYHELFGKNLITYQGPSGSRGFKALREEAKAARKPLDVYVAEKFNFSGRRAEIAAKVAAEHEAQIRADERAKTINEVANPNARAPQGSQVTFLPKPKTTGKQPWENTEGENAHERVARATATILR